MRLAACVVGLAVVALVAFLALPARRLDRDGHRGEGGGHCGCPASKDACEIPCSSCCTPQPCWTGDPATKSSCCQ